MPVWSLVKELDPTCCRAAKPRCRLFSPLGLKPVLHTGQAPVPQQRPRTAKGRKNAWSSQQLCPSFPQMCHLPASARPVLPPCITLSSSSALLSLPPDQDFEPHSQQQPRPFYTLHESKHDSPSACPRLPLCWREGKNPSSADWTGVWFLGSVGPLLLWKWDVPLC